MSGKTHAARAVQTLARATAEAAKAAHISERRWWVTQLHRLCAAAEELHGQGAVISASQIAKLLDKRGVK